MKKFPEGWFDPWISEWQLVHPRLKFLIELSGCGCVGWRLATWQESQTRGMRTFSNCGLLLPWAS
jgi:hypothetical protein